MSIYADVDNILKTLSTKFRKIFCDREFVCCVQEDFQVILKNRNKCCVVIFPVLCPNYLKAVQYQAKIFGLEVFTLGNGKICSLAVCDKKFLLRKTGDSEEQIMSSNDQEYAACSSKKKRPERQLYVPPAQRRLPVVEVPLQSSVKLDNIYCLKGRKPVSDINKKKDSAKREKNVNEFDLESSVSPNNLIKNDIWNQVENLKYFSFMWWKFELFVPTRSKIFKYESSTKSFFNRKMRCNLSANINKIFSLENVTTLYILSNDYFLWQPKVDVFMSKEPNLKVIPLINLDQSTIKEVHDCDRTPLALNGFLRTSYPDTLKDFSFFWDVDVFWLKSTVEPSYLLSVCYSDIYYFKDDCYESSKTVEELIKELLNHEDIHVRKQYETHTETAAIKVPDKQNNEKSDIDNINKVPLTDNSHLQTKKLITSKSNLNYLKNSINLTENVKVKNELEEEKEIMRKTKENINRKTRPIIKYVGDANDTLKIEGNDVNNWEDLFDEDGHLQEDLLKEIVNKVGEDVTIVKAKEDYSDYFSKHVNIEELEHMVELYDFPPSLGTHDLIHAFSEIKSDAMYIKWVDDTHAILVLGSSLQAQKAINVQNPLIKVRPMSAASKTSRAIAYRNDLKPAMKRPPTNLQTARRLITTHLGTKSGISKEKNAKEREDLKAAREMKKLVKKNEKDAWDGNLRSSMN